jgi:DNA-binding transcriptional LysR family regulator
VAVPSDHPLARQASASLAEIAREPLIGWPRTINPALYDRFAAAMDATGVPWTLVGTAVGADNVAARVLSGFGIGMIFESFMPSRPPDGIAYVPIGDDAAHVDRVLVWPKDERHAALPTFVSLATKRLAAVMTA